MNLFPFYFSYFSEVGNLCCTHETRVYYSLKKGKPNNLQVSKVCFSIAHIQVFVAEWWSVCQQDVHAWQPFLTVWQFRRRWNFFPFLGDFLAAFSEKCPAPKIVPGSAINF